MPAVSPAFRSRAGSPARSRNAGSDRVLRVTHQCQRRRFKSSCAVSTLRQIAVRQADHRRMMRSTGDGAKICCYLGGFTFLRRSAGLSISGSFTRLQRRRGRLKQCGGLGAGFGLATVCEVLAYLPFNQAVITGSMVPARACGLSRPCQRICCSAEIVAVIAAPRGLPSSRRLFDYGNAPVFA